MGDFWQRAFSYPFFLLLLALPIWAFAGGLPAALLFGIGMLIRWYLHLRHLAALQRWLLRPEAPVPDGSGLWEDAFSMLNKMMRKHRKQREQHAAALLQMEQATSALPEGVVILDDSDRIEWCNLLAEQHFGLDGERDIGQQITYLARQPEFVQYLAMRNFTEPLVLRGARQDDLVLSIKIISYGKKESLLISRDITQLERIETMRRDFVANVSHELRTPLTVVNGFVETLQDMPKLDNDMARRALKLMGEQTHRMESLVDDLLTLSRLENDQNPLREEKVEVPALLRTIEHDAKLLSNGKHAIQLTLDSEACLLGSNRRIAQCVRQSGDQCDPLYARRRRDQTELVGARRASRLRGTGQRHRHRTTTYPAPHRTLLSCGPQPFARDRGDRSGSGHRQTYRHASSSQTGCGE